MKLVTMVFALLLCSSCSTVRNMALGSATPIFIEALPELEKEGNWEQFKDGTLPNLKLVVGLLGSRPEDQNLLVAATKGYASYAYAVYETQYLADKYADIDDEDSIALSNALSSYAKALRYGLRFLALYDLDLMEMLKRAKNEDGLNKYLESELDDDGRTLEGVLFTAQALGGMINLQRGEVGLLTYLPVVKGMFDWVCQKSPDIAHGVCPIFYASYEASRPKMLGGRPEKGKAIFEKAIERYPHNWLIRVAFLEHYVISLSHENIYRQYKKELNKFEQLHQKQLKAFSLMTPAVKGSPFENERLRIYQAIAIKRFQIMKKYESDFF